MPYEPRTRAGENGGLGRLASAGVAGGIAWTLHLTGGYAIAEFGCLSPLAGRRYLGISGVAWMIAGLTAVCLVAAAVALWACWRRDAGTRAGGPGRRGEEGRLAPELARIGLAANAIFLWIIACQALPLLYYASGC